MKSYYLLELSVPKHYEESVQDFFAQYDCLGLEICHINDNSSLIKAYFDESLESNLKTIKTNFDRLNLSVDSSEIKHSKFLEKNWLKEFNDTLKPIDIGQNLTIYPVSQDLIESDISMPKIDSNSRLTVFIEPAMAFGTGWHQTTQFCLKWVEKLAPKSNDIFDFGCGTAILGIAAAKINPQAKVLCIDNDRLAYEASYRNIELNNNIKNIVVDTGSLDIVDSNRQFDLILANLTAQVIAQNLEQLSRIYLKSRGYIVLSGILTIYENLILDKFENCGLKLDSIERVGEWTNLVLQK